MSETGRATELAGDLSGLPDRCGRAGCIKGFGHVGPHEEASWATRIPAAIKRAEEVGDVYLPADPVKDTATSPRFMLTETEVALAEALWEMCDAVYNEDPQAHDWTPPPALRDFTEKVEALNG